MNFSILYFASLRDAARMDSEQVSSSSRDAQALYDELRARHGFSMDAARLRVAVNGEFAGWRHRLADGDEVAFLPPVSGG